MSEVEFKDKRFYIVRDNYKGIRWSDLTGFQIEKDGYSCNCSHKNALLLYNHNFDLSEGVKGFVSSVNENELPKELFSYQKVGVMKMIDMKTNVLLADEMGLGKTCQAVSYLKMQKDSLPAIVICPASLKENWKRELKRWANINSYILEGKNPQKLDDEFLKMYPVLIINYDILGSESDEDKQFEEERKKICRDSNISYKKRRLKVYGWCDEICSHKINTIICDEVQYISDKDTLRTRGVSQICAKFPIAKKIFISGTPYETTTSQFFTALNLLSPKNFPNRWSFLMRYCDAKKTYWGWKFDGLTNGRELHDKIKPFMIRRYKHDVLSDLPPKIRSMIPVMVSKEDRKEYDEEESNFIQSIKNREKRITQIAHIVKMRQLAFEAKKKVAVNWINDYLYSGKKLVVFVWHRNSFDYIISEFKGQVVGFTGDATATKRQTIIDKFQYDDKMRLFVGQMKASGVGITLTKSPATCFLEFGNTVAQHEQAEDRVHRISQTATNVMAYYLVLPNSIEEDIINRLQMRNSDIKKVMDNKGDAELFEENEINNLILESFKERNGL